MTKSLVTGGCGFVGRHLVDALLARGDEVVVLDMAESFPTQHERLAYLRGDITDPQVVEAAARGVEVIFHNASLVHTKQNHADRVWAVNLGGTRSVLAAARAQRVPRVVYVSSASAVYEGADIEDGDESLPYCRSSQAPYADSKIAAEKELLAASGVDGVLTIAIRPHLVFGPGDTRFLPAILARARAGQLRFAVGRQEKLSDFTYVTNLVDALLLADERLRPGSPVAGQAYFVTNGEPISFWGFVRKVLARMGLPPIRATVPFALAYSVAAIAEGIDTLKGGALGGENGMTRFAIRYMCTHHYFSIDRARRELGYAPRVSLDEGIERIALHEEGLAQ